MCFVLERGGRATGPARRAHGVPHGQATQGGRLGPEAQGTCVRVCSSHLLHLDVLSTIGIREAVCTRHQAPVLAR